MGVRMNNGFYIYSELLYHIKDFLWLITWVNNNRLLCLFTGKYSAVAHKLTYYYGFLYHNEVSPVLLTVLEEHCLHLHISRKNSYEYIPVSCPSAQRIFMAYLPTGLTDFIWNEVTSLTVAAFDLP